MKDNIKKKKALEEVLARFDERMALLKQKRDRAISTYLHAVKDDLLSSLFDSMKSL